MRLFDDTPYRDRDYAAAADWIAELTDGGVTELPAGVPGCSFCPMAIALNAHYHAPDWEPERFADPERRALYVEGIGGSSYLFSVQAERVMWPFDHARSVGDFGDIDAANEAHYDFRDDGDCEFEFVVPVVDVPEDCFGGGGMVDEFIRRFDAGEFRSLHLEV